MTVGVEHMFVSEVYQEGGRSVMKILDRSFNCRRIVDVWPIYECIISKIPLLDEKDMEKIPQSQKEYF